MDIIYRYDPYRPVSSRSSGTSDTVAATLSEGNKRYRTIVDRVQAEILGGSVGQPVVIPSEPLSLGLSLVPGHAAIQTPFALVLGCSDARVPTELIFDCSANELFIVRVAGNVLGAECLGSVEYAVRHLADDLRLIVVLGHSGCGAVAAAVDLYLSPGGYGTIVETHSLRTIIDRIFVVVRIADQALARRCGNDASGEPGYRTALWEMTVYLNAALTAQDLAREVGRLPDHGPVRVVYGVYEIETQRVAALPRGEDTFAEAAANSEEFLALSDRLAETVLSVGLLRPAEF